MKHHLTEKYLYWAKSGLHVHIGPVRKLTSIILESFVACVVFVCLLVFKLFFHRTKQCDKRYQNLGCCDSS